MLYQNKTTTIFFRLVFFLLKSIELQSLSMVKIEYDFFYEKNKLQIQSEYFVLRSMWFHYMKILLFISKQ